LTHPVVFLDNFDCHVSDEGQRVINNETGARVVPLPASSTAVCHPLDGGVMGPLKTNLRALWLGEQVIKRKEKEAKKKKQEKMVNKV
ncbi:hypothetical protein JG688_00018407, partial [Phytophthora aleatoria]